MIRDFVYSFLRFKVSKYSYHRFADQWLDNVKIDKYAKFHRNITCSSRVMSIFTKDNVNLHTYAKFDRNILCGTKAVSIFTS